MLRERGGTNRVLFSRLLRHPARKWSGKFQPRSPHWAKGGWRWRVEVGVQSCAVCISRDGNNLLHASTGGRQVCCAYVHCSFAFYNFLHVLQISVFIIVYRLEV